MSSHLRVTWCDDTEALLRFGFAQPEPGLCHIACARLAGPVAAESWHVEDDVSDTRSSTLHLRRSGGTAALHVRVDERTLGIGAATECAYRTLLDAVRGSSEPYILRIWNYFARINDGDGDDERYRQFCVGRARAVDAAFNAPPPAATAIGTDGEPHWLDVIALCSKRPGIALENPRQTPAWQYPREFGPVSPGFSRAAVVGAGDEQRLLVSGTASIVGHVSLHRGDISAQVDETFANLAALLDIASARSDRVFTLDGCESMRVYVRHREDLARAQTAVARHIQHPERVLFLRGDVCRRELDIELEGVFAPRPRQASHHAKPCITARA